RCGTKGRGRGCCSTTKMPPLIPLRKPRGETDMVARWRAATVGSGGPTTTSTMEKAQKRDSLSLSPDATTAAHEHALATGKEAAELRAVLAGNCPNQTRVMNTLPSQ